MKYINRIWNILIIVLLSNILTAVKIADLGVFKIPAISLLVLWFIWINISPSSVNRKLEIAKLKQLSNGCELLIMFLISTCISIIYCIIGFFGAYGIAGFNEDYKLWLMNILMIVLVENTVYWNGIIRVYMASEQLGFRIRIWGLVCGMIPIANMVVVGSIIKIVGREAFEWNHKIVTDSERQDYTKVKEY